MTKVYYVVEYSKNSWTELRKWREEEFDSQAEADAFALKLLGFGDTVRMYIKE
jgi:hypothetical protein